MQVPVLHSLCRGGLRTEPSSSVEDRFRQQRRNHVVRNVDHVGNAQVDRDATDDVGLFAAKAALLQQFHHVEHRVAAGERQVFRLDLAARH